MYYNRYNLNDNSENDTFSFLKLVVEVVVVSGDTYRLFGSVQRNIHIVKAIVICYVLCFVCGHKGFKTVPHL